MLQIKLAVIYYSATGANHQMAEWAAEGARDAGAEVRLLRLAETAPESAVAANPAWKKNLESTKDVQVATLDDLEWAAASLAVYSGNDIEFGDVVRGLHDVGRDG